MAITYAADIKVKPNSESQLKTLKLHPGLTQNLKSRTVGSPWTDIYLTEVSGLNTLTLNQNKGEHNYYNSEFNDISYTIITVT